MLKIEYDSIAVSTVVINLKSLNVGIFLDKIKTENESNADISFLFIVELKHDFKHKCRQ